MTEMITTAYSELTRVLPWSLRALGYSFPVADRASHIIATAAAMNPRVLEIFHQPSPRSGAAVVVREIGKNHFEICAQGLSLFEIGPAVMDFIGGRTPSEGYLRTVIEAPTDLEILSAVLLISCDYGIDTLAIIADKASKRWVLGTGSRGSRRVAHGLGLSTLAPLFNAKAELIEDLQRCFDAEPTHSNCTLFSGRGMVGELSSPLPGGDIMAADQMISQAYRRGISVAPGTLQAIYDLEKITWAPTSERSRAQAGFQHSTGGAA